MRYRKLGKTSFEISILSAGLFQLDFTAGLLSEDTFDEQLEAVRFAIEHGVNALNLGFPFFLKSPEKYTDKVKSMLKAGYRDRVKLFLNIPMTQVQSHADLDRFLDMQMDWFGLDTVDYCLIEDVERFKWVKAEKIDVAGWIREKRAAGKILHAGFDFHDDCFFLKGIFEAYDWDIAQFRYSFMDEMHHPGFSGIRYVTEVGAGLVVTDPFKSRRILRRDAMPEDVRNLWDTAKTERSVDEWALLWIWNEADVATVFTSFADTDEAKSFLRYADDFPALDMSSRILISNVADAYRKRAAFSCTACRCCMPCPINIDSPRIAALYNDYLMYIDEQVPRLLFSVEGLSEPACRKCEVCSKHCPREYDMMDAVTNGQRLFGQAPK
jgi:predicted aldo/keto reductase-like oxidoreductase